MKTPLALFSALFFIQTCTSASVEDAESKLAELRGLTSFKVDDAFTKHTNMSKEIDQIAVKTKQFGSEEIAKKTEKFLSKLAADKAVAYRCRGSRDHIANHLQQLHSEELIQCVDQQGSQSVNVLSRQRLGLAEYVWNAIYEEEKHIIVCGQRENCLDAAVADIQDKIDEVQKVIDDEVDISQHNTEVQVQAIKACASRSIANVEHALGKVPTCNF